MGGFSAVPSGQTLLGPDPPTPTPPATEIEQADSHIPQRMGAALQQQQQSQQPQQSQQQAPQGDQIEALKQSLAQRATPQQGPTGGPIKRLLQNFIGGMGQSMMHEAGLPTEYEQQQKAIGNLATITNAQQMADLHQAMASQYTPVPLVGLDGKPLVMPNGTPVTLPSMHANTWYQAQVAAAARVQAAETTAQGSEHKTISVPGVGGFNWDDNKVNPDGTKGGYAPIGGAQIPQHQLLPGEAEQMGFPAGTTQIPESLWATAARMQMAKAGKTTDTVEYRDDGKGNIVALPKRTVSTPNVPGSGTSKLPSSGGAPGPRVVLPGGGKAPPMVVGTDSSGQQIAGTQDELRTAGVQNYTPLGAAESAKVNTARQLTSPGGLFDLANKDLAAFKPGELEALAPRWNEFLAGKVGTADPRYVALRTHVNGLLSTALMQAHVGARGSGEMMEHFQDIANAGKMSKDTLQAALNAEKQYVNEKAMRPKTTPAPATNEIHYKIANGQLVKQ